MVSLAILLRLSICVHVSALLLGLRRYSALTCEQHVTYQAGPFLFFQPYWKEAVHSWCKTPIGSQFVQFTLSFHGGMTGCTSLLVVHSVLRMNKDVNKAFLYVLQLDLYMLHLYVCVFLAWRKKTSFICTFSIWTTWGERYLSHLTCSVYELPDVGNHFCTGFSGF